MTARLVILWAIVGIPLCWGIVRTAINAARAVSVTPVLLRARASD